MSDAIDDFRALKQMRKALRARYGVACPRCITNAKRANASILLPQQMCNVDRYRDPRPDLTQEDYDQL